MFLWKNRSAVANDTRSMDIVVVGPCGSGKSTLVEALTRRGYPARVVAQEHSAIPDLWRHGGEPAALIMLLADRATIARRRGGEFPAWLHTHHLERLALARVHADLLVPTDGATSDEVTRQVIDFLRSAGIGPKNERQGRS